MRYLKTEAEAWFIRDNEDGWCISITDLPNKTAIVYEPIGNYGSMNLVPATEIEVTHAWTMALCKLSAKMWDCKVTIDLNSNSPTEELEAITNGK